MRPRPLVLAVVALQVGLPLSMLVTRWTVAGSRPTSELPASWQMYSFVAPATYTGLTPSGERRLSVLALPPVVRAVDTGRVVPGRLCELHPDLTAVRRTGGPDPGTFRC